ncbi:Rieske 2Fe-2S domain-containing protein [Herbaspirillum seropedicae]|uniref:CDP-6-deoxy-L-threo-D-glycero-4-hexulose-3-dehydrase reductase protein n=1 Tax=Herbaspirillum seropedicae (strain SmR1) TaxID=757424 RepID=D8IR14_HERSS|nr:anthranilate 1,2-dioxygenase ferredoxin subunit AndAb [Herbaspirillum seropedicae]ADJ65140.1 CDP-6-deoxy-L-threo-D-glycero-4-hexulose-3-dehydrase reductase protein [Herbaspirillum seropedicae SmR1]AKN67007.1 CDP-6-deoxy-L-threo-D-glycero-4-hexulose-3-dehydrase reductase [Herbaspirillum seropedicae]NQE27982.1 CDP-6-deoxy-L-threo-D-glycero-4-hexulose-3-dehydrase reductase [Herbaspirillum seropedicae]UMU23005.1 Rieske 2Fe-2S domain-containing protein [Herbaspirillum seropedicae]
MSEWFDVGHADDFAEGEVAAARAGGQAVAVFRLGEEIFALKDLCTHGNAKLSDGYVEDGCVECPLHQGLFDIRSGAPRCAPVTEAVRSFPVRVVAGRVEIGVGGEGGGGDVLTVASPAPAAQQVQATLESLTRAAPDVAILRLRCAAPLSYRAGQYIDLLLEDGQRRSYSMATYAKDGSDLLELHVRHLPGGLFTDRLFNGMQPGQQFSLEGPAGSFFMREGTQPLILLASGTGFAPVKALVEEAIASGSTRAMRLYWGGRRAADLYLDALCRDWAASLPWFDYVPVLSEADATSGWSGRTGLVHRAVMQDVPAMQQYQVYACGAPVVVESARRDFTAACGLSETAFFADAFVSRADLRK